MAKLTLKQLQELAVKAEDQSVANKGMSFAPPKAGVGVGVLTDYIELGMQKQRPYKGKPKDDANMVYLGFDLTAPRHIRKWEKDGEEHQAPERISFTLTKKLDERAKYYKVFKAMQYGRDAVKHLSQCLGQHFKVNVTHSIAKGKDGNPDKTYANLWSEQGIGIGAPKHQPDALVDEFVDLPRGEPKAPIRIFLWANPTQETWDSLYIDGTTNDGKSKNWLQEHIMGATNFEGSPLHLMLGDVGELPIGEALDEGTVDTPEMEQDVSDGVDADSSTEEELGEAPFDSEEDAPVPIPVPAKAQAKAKTAAAPKQPVAAKPVAKAAPAATKPAPKATPAKTAPKAAVAPVAKTKGPALSPSQQALKDMGLLD